MERSLSHIERQPRRYLLPSVNKQGCPCHYVTPHHPIYPTSSGDPQCSQQRGYKIGNTDRLHECVSHCLDLVYKGKFSRAGRGWCNVSLTCLLICHGGPGCIFHWAHINPQLHLDVPVKRLSHRELHSVQKQWAALEHFPLTFTYLGLSYRVILPSQIHSVEHRFYLEFEDLYSISPALIIALAASAS